MVALRRHLVVVAWTVLSVYAIGVGRAAADACVGQEHKHGGVVVLDCAMHHQSTGSPQSAADHSHHGDHASQRPSDRNPAGAQLECHCGAELDPLYAGPPAVMQPAVSYSAPAQHTRPDAAAGEALIALLSAPPSPPPR